MFINEIFYSLQGEGRLTGLPTVFIRTGRCNLRCSYCDTTDAYETGVELSIDSILHTLTDYTCSHVCVTGGEPMLQPDLIELLYNLRDRKYECSIETNGSLDISPILNIKFPLISCDIKCPSSGMSEKMDLENIKRLRPQDQLKFIIKDKTDFSFAIRTLKNTTIECPVYVQPVWGQDIQMIASWILEEHLPIRLGLQQHKIIWGNQLHH